MAEVKKRILIVDDEKDVGWTLKLILENYGLVLINYLSTIGNRTSKMTHS
ncbi:MAG: hypothetical protein QN717_09960 [Nitrososphaeraceae archaeon]|nr:hypothetical protein [Nitrososphaeraceae archaeon]